MQTCEANVREYGKKGGGRVVYADILTSTGVEHWQC